MAGPLRFRRSTESWSERRVKGEVLAPLEETFGATMKPPWYAGPPGTTARRIEMDNGDLALFCWDDDGAYWLGNTETPASLWRTEKETFDEVAYPVARWAQRELLGQLAVEEPWLAEYDHLAWFFLPVLFSKDGRESSRRFFREHGAGFPDADRANALSFYEDALSTGVLDDSRYTMASKLGTSEGVDHTRMAAAMSEFTAAALLDRAGHDVEPEIQMDSGHALDFRADGALVEVTRPEPPRRRKTDSPVAAVRSSGQTKASGQLAVHRDATLLVDCTAFRDGDWARVLEEQPAVGHTPTVVFRARPGGVFEGYARGDVPLSLDRVFDRAAPSATHG